MKYRKKPVIIEAYQWIPENVTIMNPIPSWLEVARTNDIVRYVEEFNNKYVEINTLEGTMRGNVGDYIIKGVNGEIYPCKPDIFEKTYEGVE